MTCWFVSGTKQQHSTWGAQLRPRGEEQRCKGFMGSVLERGQRAESRAGPKEQGWGHCSSKDPSPTQNCLTLPLDGPELRWEGWGSGYSKAGGPGRASCLQGPGPEKYPVAMPNPSRSGAWCTATPLRQWPRSPAAEGQACRPGVSLRGGACVVWVRAPWRYCSVSESLRMRSSSSSSWRARRRRSSCSCACSCADSSIASRSCSS